MTRWALDIHARIGRVVISLDPSAPALVRMGISVAATAMTTVGVELDAVEGVDGVLDELDAQAHPSAVERPARTG